VLLYVLLSGSPPFCAGNKSDLYIKIRTESPIFPKDRWANISTEAIDLIKVMLSKNPKKRPSASKIALENTWIRMMTYEKYEFKEIDVDVLIQLKNFHRKSQFTKSILRFLVKELKSSDLEKLKQSFMILDKRKTGFIYIDQLKEAFDDCAVEVKFDELEAIISNSITGQKETLNYTSFIAAAIDKKHLLNKDILWETFKHFDSQNKGYITMLNFQTAFNRTCKTKKYEDFEIIFKEVGLSKDDEITFTEFCKLLEKEM